jgi:S1-C subfamily serine protease
MSDHLASVPGMGQSGKFIVRRAIALLILTALVGSLSVWAVSSYQAVAKTTLSDQRLYEPPKRLDVFIERAQEATLYVFCEPEDREYPYSGSAWHLEVAGERYLITNAHVVQACLDNGYLYVYDENGNPHRVQLLGYRHHDTYARDWDIAVLTGRDFGKALPLELEAPEAGHWVLTAGWPSVDHSYYQQVAIGNVLGNGASKTVVFSAVTNPGMSGGPVLNSAGKVVGIHYASTREESRRALAQPVSNLCDVAIVCSGDRKPLLPLQFPDNPVKTYVEDED